MKSTKIEQRINRKIAVMFEPTSSNEALVHAPITSAAIARSEASVRLEQKGDALVRNLKAAFIFFPGALYLYFGTASVLEFEFLHDFFSGAIIFLIGAAMTMFGLGVLRQPKYLAVPTSIVIVSAVVYAFFVSFVSAGAVFQYGVWLFPIAVVASLIVKAILDSTKSEIGEHDS